MSLFQKVKGIDGGTNAQNILLYLDYVMVLSSNHVKVRINTLIFTEAGGLFQIKSNIKYGSVFMWCVTHTCSAQLKNSKIREIYRFIICK